MKKNIYFYTNLLAWGLVLFLIGNYAFGWTTPSLDPPAGNITPSFSQWTTSGSNIYYNTGNVGIGMTSPGAKLSFYSSANENIIQANGPYDPYFTIWTSYGGGNANVILKSRDDVTGKYSSVELDPWDDSVLRSYDPTDGTGQVVVYPSSISFTTKSWSRVFIDGVGNVGIGTLAPKNKLDVEGGGVIGATYSGTNTAPSNGLLVEGNVGIGTTEPAGKLEIDGRAPTGDELVTNGTFTGSANGWILGSDATYADNAVIVTYTGGDPSLTTNFEVEEGKTYLLAFTISNVSGDFMYCYDNLSGESSGPFGNGSHTHAFEAWSTGTDTMYFESWNWNIDGTWTIDDVSIKEVVVSPALKVIGYTGDTALLLSGDILGNTAIGLSALHSNIYGYYNTAMGDHALYSNTTGRHNTAVGNKSLVNNISGIYNTAVGKDSLVSNTTGNFNIAIGAHALVSNTTGLDNVSIGVFSLDYNTIGSDNIAVGYYALYQNEGSKNTGIGSNAGRYNTGSNNTMIGYYAGAQLPGASFSNNTLIGYKAGSNLTTGSNNIVIGYDIKAPSVTSSNTLNIGNLIFATGVDGIQYTLSTGNVGIGTTNPGAKLDVAGRIWQTGTGRSVFLGEGAGQNDDLTSNYNVFVGYKAGYYNTTGIRNSAMGYQAFYFNTYGNYNSAMGFYALYYNTTGYGNSAMGFDALYSNTTGYYNTAMGYKALYYLKPTSKAITAFADSTTEPGVKTTVTSTSHNLTGSTSITISGTTHYNGTYTTSNVTTDTFDITKVFAGNDATGWWGIDSQGRYNTALGYQAGDNIGIGSNNIIIGYDVDAPSASGDNQLNIGNTIYGDLSTDYVGIGISNPGTKLAVPGLTGTTGGSYLRYLTDGTGKMYYDSSSEKYKDDIRPLKDDFYRIMQIEPKSFVDKVTQERNIGYIAEELDELGLNYLVGYTNGEPDFINYERISIYLLEIIKDQEKRIEILEEKINR